MANVLVRIESAQELIIDKLVSLGVFKTKSEAIRASIMQLAKEYKLFENAGELEEGLLVAKKMAKISMEIKAGKRKVFSEEDVKKQYNL
jgi:Arc/MetJ-type ribon-helix-helix transcriptional regulator